jgi:hypothetical protein
MPTEAIFSRIRRALLLEDAAFVEIRDDATFTPFAIGLAAIAVLVAGFGAFLYSETVLDFVPDGWFVDTVILGTIFTALLFMAGIAVTYVMITQVYRLDIAPDALARVALVGYLPFVLGFFVFIPELGFAFGILSVAAMFFYTIYGLRAALPGASGMAVMLSVLAGFAVWAILIPLISDYPDNNFVTGVFVYGLAA